ncbi:MAG: ferrous iron transport protein B [Prevotella sp.]|nr:ferrous iron transport protein B [Prevotella sp.]
MKLSELHTGQSGVIVKVTGHGGFRKRIVEMGFIKGKKVEVLLNAPLKDPVKYKIMGYEVSLRHSEADMIEVITQEEARRLRKNEKPGEAVSMEDLTLDDNFDPTSDTTPNTAADPMSEEQLQEAAMNKRRVINVALVGNPNCGKTSLFNFVSGAHENVGNYSGVTVDAKEGHVEWGGYRFNLVDLPGTYSLSAYSPEELYVRKQLVEKSPDIVINVIDTSNIERNLYLTTQLIDMHVRMVVALNMYDETRKRGDHVDYAKLSELFGVPMVPTVFKSGEGVDDLFRMVVKTYEGIEDKEPSFRHIHINHGHEIENGIADIQEHLKQESHLREYYSTRYLAIKLLEYDRDVENYIRRLPDADEILHHRDITAHRVMEETKTDLETSIMDAKYGFIHGALKEAEYQPGSKADTYRITHLLDRILTNRLVGFPIFIIVLCVMFFTTFSLGAYPMDWIDMLVAWLGEMVGQYLPDGPVKAMLVDGILGGVGSVVVFLPQILILYFFISFMEDSGYMSRAAFIMDKLMHKIGLHGKSFIPLIMGFGCNVPAIMATRTIESRRSRLVTMLILPLMSCEARIPIYIMIVGTFFGLRVQWLVMLSLYMIGILIAMLISKGLTKSILRGEDVPFVMELPPYRFPTAKALFRHTWEKGKQYLKKMGGIILVASIIVWGLGYFPHDENLTQQQQQEQSFIGRIGKTVEPVFRPQGFNWKLDVGLLAGVGAKEIVASTLGVLYANDDSFADGDNNANSSKYHRLHEHIASDLATINHVPQSKIEPMATLTAYCFLLFVLLYFPCVATIAAIKEETGSWRWAGFAAVYTTVLAWMVSAVVYQVGSLLIL